MRLPAFSRSLWIAASLLMGIGPALAAETADKVRLRYDVTFSGVRALELRYDASLSTGAYNAQVDVKLKGIAKMLIVGMLIAFLVVPTMSHPDKLIGQAIPETLAELHRLIVMILFTLGGLALLLKG